MDKENLSKVKYIYRIYESSDLNLHLEKYPVIYINSEVVYFKKHGSHNLTYIYVSSVNESFLNVYNSTNFMKAHIFDRYFWNVDDIDEKFNQLKEQYENFNIEDEVKKSETYLEIAKRNYEEAINKANLMRVIKDSIDKKE